MHRKIKYKLNFCRLLKHKLFDYQKVWDYNGTEVKKYG